MSAVGAQDLLALDREVARAARSLEEARRALAGPGWEAAAEGAPLEASRRVAGKKMRDALLALTPSRADLPLRDGLSRWVSALTAARVGWELEAAAERAARAPEARPKHAAPAPEPAGGHQRAALEGLLRASSPGELSARLDEAAKRAPAIAAARAERSRRLFEVASRLGAGHVHERALVHRPLGLGPPPAPGGAGSQVTASADLIAVLAADFQPRAPTEGDARLPCVAPSALEASASSFLQATEPIARAVLERAHRARAGRAGVDARDRISVALAREGRVDWPARLNAAWLLARFSALVGPLSFPVAELPAPLGASSFLRAAASFGRALRAGASRRGQPFAVACDPQFTDAHRTGAALALAVASRPFLTRELGAGRSAAEDEARSLGASLLFEARARATALLLSARGAADEALAANDRAVGGLYARLSFTTPRPSDDEPARWLALLTAPAFVDGLVASFDEDFYRNPRAGAALRARAARPALETTFLEDEPPDLPALAASLARRLEGTLA